MAYGIVPRMEPMTTQDPQKAKWYHSWGFVLLMLFFVLGPFGIPLVWKNPRFSQWVKIALTLAVLIYTVALFDVAVKITQDVLHNLPTF